MMDKLQAMQVFLHVADTQSFSRAAQAAHLSRASVTTIIQNLENSLKTKLLNRTTRNVSLTTDGVAYYERSSRVLAEIAEIEHSLSSTAVGPRGKLRVEMPTAIGRLIVAPALDEFHKRYPDIDLMFGFEDKSVGLLHDEVDCAIKIGALHDSLLVSRPIGLFESVTAASQHYLRTYGEPQTTDELSNHHAVNFFSARSGRILDMHFVVGDRDVSLRMKSKLAANDTVAYLSCGLKGLGLIQVPRMLALPYLRTGELIEVMANYRPRAMTITIVYPHHRRLSSPVQVFADWIVELFEQHPLLTTDGPDVATPTPALASGLSPDHSNSDRSAPVMGETCLPGGRLVVAMSGQGDLDGHGPGQ